MLQLDKKKSSKLKSEKSIKTRLISRTNCAKYTCSNNETSS